MMAVGSARQTKGFASVALCSAMNRLMAACRSRTEWKAPCLRRRRVSLAKKPSTAFSQELYVGVKWNVQRGWRASQRHTSGVLCDETLSRMAWTILPAGISCSSAFRKRMNS